jgi:FMN phosphatase YigB (HAD superfamily)
MCGAAKNVARLRPQAVVAIDGHYVELVEKARPTGKKTVILPRRSEDGLRHRTLARDFSGQHLGELTSVWREGRKLRGEQAEARGGGHGEG